MKLCAKIALGVGVVLIAIQFIRPARNLGVVEGPNFIGTKHAVPAEINRHLQRSCYDCHSNQTKYPFYANIQPVGWWLDWHVRDAKKHLNFSEFATYTPKRAAHKLEEVAEEVRKKHMPLDSYLWMHDEAKLTEAEIEAIAQWADALRATIPLPPAT
ncbi:MAG: heme-binding domain-containing protein [Candidatus Didemnitutus sp.]|nr:heme-binding domain-containing protein [Candidatus Didemnitutus sp.]